jgi:hypothetical protein
MRRAPACGKPKERPVMPIERINILNDFIFTAAMGTKGDEVQLTAFLNAVLRRTGKERIESVEILENKDFPAGKPENWMSWRNLRRAQKSISRYSLPTGITWNGGAWITGH